MSTETNGRVAVDAKAYADATPEISTPRDLGWVRHEGVSEWWHSIAAFSCGSVAVECGGRMSVTAPFDLEARPAIGDRCLRCQALRTQRRLVEAGLAELREAAP